MLYKRLTPRHLSKASLESMDSRCMCYLLAGYFSIPVSSLIGQTLSSQMSRMTAGTPTIALSKPTSKLPAEAGKVGNQ